MLAIIRANGVTAHTNPGSLLVIREAVRAIAEPGSIEETQDRRSIQNAGGDMLSADLFLDPELFKLLMAGLGVAGGAAVVELTKDVYRKVKEAIAKLCERNNESRVPLVGVRMAVTEGEPEEDPYLVTHESSERRRSQSSISFRISVDGDNRIDPAVLAQNFAEIEKVIARVLIPIRTKLPAATINVFSFLHSNPANTGYSVQVSVPGEHTFCLLGHATEGLKILSGHCPSVTAALRDVLTQHQIDLAVAAARR